MIIYNYDEQKVFVSQSEAKANPLEQGNFLIPRNATDVAIPVDTLTGQECWLYDEGLKTWSKKYDYRNQYSYGLDGNNLWDRTIVALNISNTINNAIRIQPPENIVIHKWNGTAWEEFDHDIAILNNDNTIKQIAKYSEAKNVTHIDNAPDLSQLTGDEIYVYNGSTFDKKLDYRRKTLYPIDASGIYLGNIDVGTIVDITFTDPTVPPDESLMKAKWNGTAWIEDITLAEAKIIKIDKIKLNCNAILSNSDWKMARHRDQIDNSETLSLDATALNVLLTARKASRDENNNKETSVNALTTITDVKAFDTTIS